MKGKARLLMVLAALYPLSIAAQGIADIIHTLRDVGCFKADVRFVTTLPQNSVDVAYDLNLTSMATPADTLSPAAYLIDWTLPAPSGKTSTGFTAYFDGNYYRYRDSRLQEYHATWDIAPFLPPAPTQLPLPSSTQFADLLPQMIADEIARMQTTPSYTLTLGPTRLFDGHTVLPLEATMEISGETALQRTYLFDAQTLLPLRIYTESNPGRLTEQTVTATYAVNPAPRCTPLSEEALMALHPSVFEKFRLTDFRIENLPGLPLPTIALPTSTAERYTHNSGDPFARPTVIVLIDPTSPHAPELVATVRSAVDLLITPADIIWAVATTNPQQAEQTVGEIRPGEHLLINARTLARDCGAPTLPATIVADRQGIVKNIALGMNKTLDEFVIQTVTLCE